MAHAAPATALPAPSAIAELFKPITWFPPMWAFACGVVASGQSLEGRWGLVLAGVLLGVALLKPTIAGPFFLVLVVTGRWRRVSACGLDPNCSWRAIYGQRLAIIESFYHLGGLKE